MCREISELFDWILLLDHYQGIAISDALQHPWLKNAVRLPVLSVCLSLPTSVISCNSSNQARGRFDRSHVFRGDLLMCQVEPMLYSLRMSNVYCIRDNFMSLEY